MTDLVPDLITAIKIVAAMRRHLYEAGACEDCRAHSLRCLECRSCRDALIQQVARLIAKEEKS
jgi:hypothetical protein